MQHPRIYPDFLCWDPKRGRRVSPSMVWDGFEWSINLRLDAYGRCNEATVFAYRVETPEQPPVGVVEVAFGPFDDLAEILREGMIDAAIRGSQLPLW